MCCSNCALVQGLRARQSLSLLPTVCNEKIPFMCDDVSCSTRSTTRGGTPVPMLVVDIVVEPAACSCWSTPTVAPAEVPRLSVRTSLTTKPGQREPALRPRTNGGGYVTR